MNTAPESVQAYSGSYVKSLMIKLFILFLRDITNREPLLKGKAQYSWPPRINSFRLAAFDIENIIYFLTKQASLMRMSTVLSLSLQLVFPVKNLDFKLGPVLYNFKRQ